MGITFNGKELVSQGYELIKLADEAELGLSQLKLLNAYLAKIDPRRPSTSVVKFSVRDYAELIGIPYKNIDLAALDENLKALSTVSVTCKAERVSSIHVSAFEYTGLSREDAERGRAPMIVIKCSEIGAHLFFDLAKSRYLKYRLAYVTGMKCGYSYPLYLYLLENKYKKSPVVLKLSELRKILKCKKKYEPNRDFFKKVLSPAIDEINTLTNMTCTIEKIPNQQDRRQIEAVAFYVSLKDHEELEERNDLANEEMEEIIKSVAAKAEEKVLTDLGQAEPENSLIPEQMPLPMIADKIEGEDESETEDSWQQLFRSIFDKCKFTLSVEERDMVIAEAQMATYFTEADMYDYIRSIVLRTNLKKSLPSPMKYMIGIIKSEEAEKRGWQ